MSVGNSKDNNNKGRNFPFQHNVLKGLQKLVDDDNTAIFQAIATLLASTIRTPGRIEVPPGTVGSIAAGFVSYTISNIGNTDALVDGVIFPSGWVEEYIPPVKDVLAAMSYDSQATTLLITTIS